MVADVLVRTNESSITNENSVFAPAAAVANNTFQSLPLFNAVVVICKIAVGAEDCQFAYASLPDSSTTVTL